MLPMRFRPNTQGEVVPRDHEIVLPPSARTKVWQQATRMALDFWQPVESETTINGDFKRIAGQALDVIEMALRRFG